MTIKFTRRSVCALGAAALGCAAFPPFAAEDPIRIIVPYPPGGPLDVTARAVAEEARHDLGNIIVENKPGAGGNIGVDYVAKQAPDGKTIVMGALATHAVNPNLFSKLPYDPIKDFTPITLIAQTPNVLVITPEFSQKTGIKIVHIPFKGAAAAQMSVLSGDTQMIFDNLASASANIKAGKLIPLAVTTTFRAPSLPNVPTMAEAGVPGFDISTWYAFFGPAKMDPKVVEKLNQAFVKAIKSKPMAERFDKMGAVEKAGTPAQLNDFVKAELVKYKEIVKTSGAKVD